VSEDTPLPTGLPQATGQAYWRGLDELVDEPGFMAALAERFPALATGPFSGEAGDWRRRDILKCLGGAVALAGLDGCERRPDEEALPAVVADEDGTPGVARFYATAVELDGVAQPLLGKTREGRPVKLEGNPEHPASLGATDAFGQAALLDLYDPDRSAAPLERGTPTTWARAEDALTGLRAALDASGGAGFRLLTGPVGSPTLRRQIAGLLARWPGARWHVLASGRTDYTAGGDLPRLDRAEAVVCLDADPLGPGPWQVWNATRWGQRRRAFQGGAGSASLYVAEPSPTITGVTATRRLAAAPSRIGVLLAALAARVGVAGVATAPLTSPERAWVDAAGQALAKVRGRGLILVGKDQPAPAQALTSAIEAHLGNGATRTALPPLDALVPVDAAALLPDMAAGRVRTLLVLGANPAYALPGFAEAAARIANRLHAGLHVDETAQLAHWHLPLAHLLESWSDGRAADGSAVPIQPLVRPWLDARSRHAVLGLLLGDSKDDRTRVRETWPQLSDGAAWEEALLKGRIAGSEPAAVSPRPAAAPAPLSPPSPTDGLSLVVRPDPCVWDGSLAGNPWLQELPKPLTKLTWGNAVHVSPALAREQGLKNGDMVRLTAGDRSVTGPVWILPGQERHTVLVHLGHGRRAGSKVAQGVGFDVHPLLGATGPVRLERADGSATLASTQQHFAMEEDEFVRFVDTLADTLPPEPPASSFYPPQKSSPAWGMAIDLDLCIGCNACVVACVAENNVPMVGAEQVAKGREMHWLRVDRYYRGDPDDPVHAFQPVPCMHCEDAPCEMGCPVNATVHSPDGLNLQVYNRCIGTRTCSAYCPYKVRRFNWFDLTSKDPPELRAARNPEVTVRSRGVMEKCTYCIQRISAARITAKKEDRAIAEGEVVTACQAACPTQAIVFGDVSRPDSAVSTRKAGGRDYDLLAEAQTRPRTTYQARIRSGESHGGEEA